MNTKLTINENIKSQTTFGQLDVGSWFKFNNELFIKINELDKSRINNAFSFTRNVEEEFRDLKYVDLYDKVVVTTYGEA